MKRLSGWAWRAPLALAIGALGVGCGEGDARVARVSAEPAPTISASAPAPTHDSVVLTKRYPAVGDKETSTQTQIVGLKGKVDGPRGEVPVDSVSTSTTEKVEECLEVKDQWCTKLKVTFTKDQKHTVMNGKEKDEPSPVDGKTVIVTATPTGREISFDDGSTPSAAALEHLAPRYRDMGRGKEVFDALPTSVKVGDSLDAFAKKLSEVHRPDGPAKTTLSLSVREIRDQGGKKLVVLDVHLTQEGDHEKVGPMKSTTSGTMILRADTAVPILFEVAGPVEMPGRAPTGKLEGTFSSKIASAQSF